MANLAKILVAIFFIQYKMLSCTGQDVFISCSAPSGPLIICPSGVETTDQTVKFFQCAENISLNSEKLRRKTILSQTIFARILTLNATFAPRSPLQPTPRAPRLACPSHYSSFCFIKPSIQRSELLGLY